MAERRISKGSAINVGGLKSGDVLLLERGGVWTTPISLPAGVRLGAFGSGNKPLIRNTPGTALNLANNVVVEDIAFDNCVTNASTDRTVMGYGAKNVVLRRLTVSNTKGGDNIYMRYCDDLLIEDCDLSNPGPMSGDQIHIVESMNPVIRRCHMHGSLKSGKGHFMVHQYLEATSGGLIEDCVLEGNGATYGIGIAQSGFVARRNKISGIVKYAAMWFNNDEFNNKTSSLTNEIYDNEIINSNAAIGSWNPVKRISQTLHFHHNTIRNGSQIAFWEGGGPLLGKFEHNLVEGTTGMNLANAGSFTIGDNWINAGSKGKDGYGVREEPKPAPEPEPKPEPEPEPEPKPEPKPEPEEPEGELFSAPKGYRIGTIVLTPKASVNEVRLVVPEGYELSELVIKKA